MSGQSSDSGAKAPYWVNTPREGSDPPARTSGSGAASATANNNRKVRKGQELYVPPKTNPASPPQPGATDSPQAPSYRSYDDYDDDYSQPSGGRRRGSRHHSTNISPQHLSARSSPGPEPPQPPRSARGTPGSAVSERVPIYYGDVAGARDKGNLDASSPGTLAVVASAAAAAALQGAGHVGPTPLFGGMPRGLSGPHMQRATSHASIASGTSWMNGQEAPSNPGFNAPKVPQPEVTRIGSINGWALMAEAGANNLEVVLSPLVQAVLVDQAAGAAALDGLPPLPWTAQVVLELMLKPPVSERLSLAQGAQLIAASKAVHSLMQAADQMTAAQAVEAQQAFQGVLQDFIKALEQPSLLRSGSVQYQHFLDAVLQPQLASAVVYAGMLVHDVQDTHKVHEAYSAAVLALSSPKIVQAGREHAEISLAGGLAGLAV